MNETKLAGRYALVERIAAGGMGTVYRATDERLGRTVAVKMLRAELADDPRFVERFRREARAVAALSHPNIAGVYDYGEGDDHHFIVMEYVDGRDLAHIMRTESPLEPERAALIAAGTLDALQHAHSAGVVHRDIKPGNIIVTRAGRSSAHDVGVKVTDFGIARAVGDATLTATGSVLGTAHYLSPEQASGGSIGPASDQYSTGIVLYEMLVGTVPFTGDSPVAIAMRHMSDEPAPPSSANPEVPPALDAAVARATRKDPAERYPDAHAMAVALRRAVEGGAAPAAAPVGSGTAVLGGPGSTAVLTDAVEDGTRPLPTEGWDPQRLGRAVLFAFAALIAAAVILLMFRLFAAGDEPTRAERPGERGGAQAPAEEEPAEVTIPDDIIGKPFDDAERQLSEELGLSVQREDAPSEDYDPGIVAEVEPPSGSTVSEGATVTLTVSTGPAEDDDDEEDNGGGEDDEPRGSEGRGPPPGKGPEDKGKDED